MGLNQNELVPTPQWSAEDIKFLVEHRYEMSVKDLAERLGKTKGAVAGKLKRVGIKVSQDFTRMMLSRGLRRMHAQGTRSYKHLVNSKKGDDGWKAIATVYKRGEKAVPKHMIEPPVGILDGVGVKLWLLEHHHCKWVVGEPSDLTCCGQNRYKDSPYCQEHNKIAYKEPRRQG